MSIDILQEKIRKTKNPSVLYLEGSLQWLPPQYAHSPADYYAALLRELKGLVPAVRLAFGSFALMGAEGLQTLTSVSRLAKERD